MRWARRAAMVAVLLTLAPAVARAQEGSVDTYTAARESYAAEDYDKALEQFRQVLADTDSPNARLYVARCLLKKGELVAAYDEMARTVRDASEMAKGEARFAATRDAAIKELDAIQSQVGRVTVELEGDSEGVEVTLNGAPLQADQLGIAKGVEPGAVVVEAKAAGRGSARREVRVDAGGLEKVTLQLAATQPVPEPPKPEPEPDQGAAPSGMMIGGVVALGVGVAGMVAFAVTGSMAKGKFDELKDNCGDGPCADPTFDATVDDGEKLQTIANAMLGVGAIGLAAGAALILVDVLGGDGEDGEHGFYLAPTGAGGVAGYRTRF